MSQKPQQDIMNTANQTALAHATRLIQAVLTDDRQTVNEIENSTDNPDHAWLVAAHAAEIAATFLQIHARTTDQAVQHLRAYRDDVLFGEGDPEP